MATGDGYLIKATVEGTGEEIEKCVPACERPDWVEDPDGWGYEHRETCIVSGSNAEMQVSRCTLVPHTFPWEPGPGTMLKDGTTMQETCYPPCVSPDGETEHQRRVRRVVCAASSSGLFQVVLTPHHDAAHANHVHLEVRPDVTWRVLE